MHAAIYDACPGAGFIVHTHADACTALACLGSELPAFHYMVLQFGGADVRCAPVRHVRHACAGTARGGGDTGPHRRVCWPIMAWSSAGQRRGEALSPAVLLETLCRQYLLALSAGTPRLLTAQEMLDAQERFKTYGPRGPA